MALILGDTLTQTLWRCTEMGEKETQETPQNPPAETGELEISELETVAGGYDPDQGDAAANNPTGPTGPGVYDPGCG